MSCKFDAFIFIDFGISRGKGYFLKNTIDDLGMNGGKKFIWDAMKLSLRQSIHCVILLYKQSFFCI